MSVTPTYTNNLTVPMLVLSLGLLLGSVGVSSAGRSRVWGVM